MTELLKDNLANGECNSQLYDPEFRDGEKRFTLESCAKLECGTGMIYGSMTGIL